VFDTHAVNPFLQNLSFDTQKDLEPVLLIGTAPNVVATHPERSFKTFAEPPPLRIAASARSPWQYFRHRFQEARQFSMRGDVTLAPFSADDDVQNRTLRSRAAKRSSRWQ
jgi:hypothetical protein